MLNQTTPKSKTNAVSENGNPQFLKDQHQMLMELAIGMSYGKDAFYESFGNQSNRLYALIDALTTNAKDIEYVANTILFVRKHIGLRTLPIVMLVHMAKSLRKNNVNWLPMRYLVTETIQRADDITELFAYAELVFANKNAIPKSIKKGIADSFLKFDEYQLQKYNRKGREKRLKDVMNVVHPKPLNEDQSFMFKRLIEDKLETPYTWETVLSANGQLPQNQRKTDFELWFELVNKTGSGNLPYQAMLRNLRNIESSLNCVSADKAKQLIDSVVNKLTDEKTLNRLQLFPWSFMKAYESVNNTNLRRAINQAAEMSLKNIPKLGNNIWIILDESGSMDGTPMMHASNLCASLAKSAELNNTFNVKVTKFATSAVDWKVPVSGYLEISKQLAESARGGGTNLGAALDLYKTLGFAPDCIIVLSDMQINSLSGYEHHILKKIEADVSMKLAFNLHSAPSTPLKNTRGWIQFEGWSDRLFQYLDLEKDSGFARRLYDQPLYTF